MWANVVVQAQTEAQKAFVPPPVVTKSEKKLDDRISGIPEKCARESKGGPKGGGWKSNSGNNKRIKHKAFVLPIFTLLQRKQLVRKSQPNTGRLVLHLQLSHL